MRENKAVYKRTGGGGGGGGGGTGRSEIKYSMPVNNNKIKLTCSSDFFYLMVRINWQLLRYDY